MLNVRRIRHERVAPRHAQAILDKFKKREKKGDSKEVVEDLEAKLGEVAEQVAASQQAAAEREAAAAGAQFDGYPLLPNDPQPQICLK